MIKERLVIRFGFDQTATEIATVECFAGFICLEGLRKLNKNLNDHIRIVILGIIAFGLALLVDNDPLHNTIFTTLVLNLILQRFVDILRANHIAQYNNLTLTRPHESLHDQVACALSLDGHSFLLLQRLRFSFFKEFFLQFFLLFFLSFFENFFCGCIRICSCSCCRGRSGSGCSSNCSRIRCA
ncbi:AAEL004413-PA [Aedes aegypti]|uniref:AAEL004413-PA n=1 Tax=Aedes aegypti TaxID=7159 RepID=Q17CW2_AEDAE|nr:AAEL004413-PA [Aedes aegypti]